MLNIENIKKEYEKVLQQLSDPELISDWPASAIASAGGEEFEALLKRKEFLEKILEKEKELQEIKNRIEENKAIIAAKEDQELVSLAETEIAQLQEKEKILEKELAATENTILSPSHLVYPSEARGGDEGKPEGANFIDSDKAERAGRENSASCIIEIRAGTGGEEAALFTADLFKMYSKYAGLQSWKAKVLDSRPTSLNGFKEIVFEVSGEGVFSKMQAEAGVHRVQRIPATEKSGRIHTSTVSVAVLPKPKKGKIVINPNDLKIDTYKSSGPGGQYVNKRMTAVRITHLPTGFTVTSQTERNLQQNKENAMSILEARLLEKKEIAELEKLGEKRKAQIGGAKRAEKIRTYNFPQDRVTDHRIKKSFHNLQEIMEGKLEPIIKEFLR